MGKIDETETVKTFNTFCVVAVYGENLSMDDRNLLHSKQAYAITNTGVSDYGRAEQRDPGDIGHSIRWFFTSKVKEGMF